MKIKKTESLTIRIKPVIKKKLRDKAEKKKITMSTAANDIIEKHFEEDKK